MKKYCILFVLLMSMTSLYANEFETLINKYKNVKGVEYTLAIDARDVFQKKSLSYKLDNAVEVIIMGEVRHIGTEHIGDFKQLIDEQFGGCVYVVTIDLNLCSAIDKYRFMNDLRTIANSEDTWHKYDKGKASLSKSEKLLKIDVLPGVHEYIEYCDAADNLQLGIVWYTDKGLEIENVIEDF